MIKTLDFVLEAKRDPKVMRELMVALSEKDTEIIIGEHRLTFDTVSRQVIIEDAAGYSYGKSRIVPCKMPYHLLERVLCGDYADLSGLEWIDPYKG